MATPGTDYEKHLRFFQRGYFLDLIARCDQNMAEVARVSGIERSYLYRLLTQLGINPRRTVENQRLAGIASQAKQRAKRDTADLHHA